VREFNCVFGEFNHVTVSLITCQRAIMRLVFNHAQQGGVKSMRPVSEFQCVCELNHAR
jgi:hypothetical protein